MFTLKLLLVVIVSFQVSICVLAQNNVTDDARKALDLLLERLEDSSEVVLIDYLLKFPTYFSDIKSTFDDYLQTDADNFWYILGNITAIAFNTANGRECIELLVNPPRLEENIFTPNELIADKLYAFAYVDIAIDLNQFYDLNATFTRNCVDNKRNCEGTSRAVLAKVERLLPKVNRVPVELFTEAHVLIYKFAVDLENAHAELMETYNKGVQNATLCLASKITDSTQNTTPPVEPSGSVFDLFEDLVIITESATAASVINLISPEDQVVRQSTIDYLYYIKGVSTAISRANNTINFLIGTAEEYNVTLNCAIPDLSLAANSSYERIVHEFQLLVNDTLIREFGRGIQDINEVGREINSITLEIESCAGDGQCGYLAQNIASKQSEIPWLMEKVANSTIVLLQQSITAVRESGARVVRDTQEQLEVSLIDLKSCIQNSL